MQNIIKKTIVGVGNETFADMDEQSRKDAASNYFEKITEKFAKYDDICRSIVLKSGWYSHGYKQRWIWTIYGPYRLKRRIYKHKTTGKYAIFLDAYLDLDSYIYVQKKFYVSIANAAAELGSYKAVSNFFKGSLSTNLVAKIMNDIDLYFMPKKISDKQNIVYISVDGSWARKHKGKSYERKYALMFTSSSKTTSGRTKLINKALIPINKGMSTDEIAHVIVEYAHAIYGEIKKFVIIGDGALWISQLKNYIPNSIRVIDQFHWTKIVKDLIGRGKGRKIDLAYFKTCSLKEAETKIRNYMLEFDGVITMSKNENKILQKILRHHEEYKINCANGFINPIEAIQSHVPCKILKNRRFFKESVAYKFLMIKVSRYNGWNITSDKNQGFSINQINEPYANINVSMLDSHRTNLPGVSHTSTGIGAILNSIAHGNVEF